MVQQNLKNNLMEWNKFSRYSAWMYHMYQKHVGQKILDIGGGIGTAISFYITTDKQVLSTELFDDNVRIMNERFSDFKNFKAIRSDIVKDDFAEYGKFDTIIMINVLEHIEDDVFVLQKLKDLLTDNGKIIICVPALEFLYCNMDKNVGHYRRYKKGELKQKAQKVGLNILEDKYMNFLGIIPYWLKGKLSKNQKGSFSTKTSKNEAKLYSLATVILEPLEKLFKPRIGLSEFIILQKSSILKN